MKTKIDHLRQVYRLIETDKHGMFAAHRGGFDNRETAEARAATLKLKFWRIDKN